MTKESREGQEQGQRKTKSRRGSLRDSDSLQGGKDHTARLPGLGENRRWEEQVGNQRPPVPCGDQTTKAREDSELGTHPTEGRAQHPQSSRPWVVTCTNSPLFSLRANPSTLAAP